jgi:hypothetical protein
MSLFKVFLILSTLLPLQHIIIRKRKFDLLSIYTILLVLFSAPLYFGLMYNPYTRLFENNTLQDETLVIYSIPFICVFLALIFRDSQYFRNSKVLPSLYNRTFTILCAAICSIIYISFIPDFINATTKVEMLENVDFRFIILTSIVPAAFYYALVNADKTLAIYFFGLVLLLFMVGTRRPFALCLVILLLVELKKNEIFLYNKYKEIFVGFVLISLVILGKSFYSYFLSYGPIGAVFWFNEFDLNMVLTGAEFMSTSVILNEIVVQGFKIDLDVVPKSLLAITPIPLSIFGFSSSIFNDLFQPVLFNGIRYGMAYNPWAESYSWLSYPGVILYSLVIPISIIVLEVSADKKKESPIGAMFFVMAILLAVWVHRSSVGSELAYIRNAMYPIFLIYMLSLIFKLSNHNIGK